MNMAFFRMNPSSKLPVFQNGAHVIFHAIDIIQYIDRLAVRLSCGICPLNTEVYQWMQNTYLSSKGSLASLVSSPCRGSVAVQALCVIDPAMTDGCESYAVQIQRR